MPMLYTDEPDAFYRVAQDRQERASLGTIYTVSRKAGEPDLGQIELFREIITKLGLRDPIAHYEPGVPLDEVWQKYSISVLRYPAEISRIRSTSAQRELTKELEPLQSLRARIAPAFAPGARPGARDRDRLAELVYGVRVFRKHLGDARAKYGMGAPQADTFMAPTEVPPTPPPPAEIPIWIPLAAAGAFLLLA